MLVELEPPTVHREHAVRRVLVPPPKAKAVAFTDNVHLELVLAALLAVVRKDGRNGHGPGPQLTARRDPHRLAGPTPERAGRAAELHAHGAAGRPGQLEHLGLWKCVCREFYFIVAGTEEKIYLLAGIDTLEPPFAQLAGHLRREFARADQLDFQQPSVPLERRAVGRQLLQRNVCILKKSINKNKNPPKTHRLIS